MREKKRQTGRTGLTRQTNDRLVGGFSGIPFWLTPFHAREGARVTFLQQISVKTGSSKRKFTKIGRFLSKSEVNRQLVRQKR
jgi:hypothetical protein